MGVQVMNKEEERQEEFENDVDIEVQMRLFSWVRNDWSGNRVRSTLKLREKRACVEFEANLVDTENNKKKIVLTVLNRNCNKGLDEKTAYNMIYGRMITTCVIKFGVETVELIDMETTNKE